MQLFSEAFESGETIPARYSGLGENVAPPLSWRGVPTEATALAIVCEDPDVAEGTFTHWLVYDIPSGGDSIGERFDGVAADSDRIHQGRNDFGNIGYDGPAPPEGEEHSYHFRLYALPRPLGLGDGLARGQVIDRLEKESLAVAEMIVRCANNVGGTS